MPADGMTRGESQLGIDFGTSNTVAVVRWPDGRARPLLFDGSPLLPSAIYAEPSGALIVGRDAVYSSRLDPARFEPNPKRRIDDGTVLLGDREVPVVDLIAAVLRRVADEYRRTVGTGGMPVATLTCPAAWGATRRKALTEAAARVGFTQTRLVAEPVAAATYFAQSLGRDVPIGSVVVVHDFGAGTFDASVVARTSSGFDVLAVDGRDDIGGLDVDAAVIGHIEKLYASRAPEAFARLASPSTVEERRAKRLLWDDVKAAKERLSRNPTADLVIPLADIEVHLTREELEGLAQPLLEQTVRVTQGVIRWSNLAPGRVAGVFLVGGSSRIPLMATLLHREMGEPPVVLEQPELVVAEGSILAGALELASGAQAVPGPATGMMPRLTPEMFGPAGMPAAPGVEPGPGGTLAGAGSPGSAAGGFTGGQSSAAPVSPPVGQPVSGGPAYSIPPLPASSPPVSGAPVSGVPVSGAPTSGVPTSGAPVSGAPVSGVPVSPAADAGSAAVGRVIVPGAQPPGGRRTPPGPVAPTRHLPRYTDPAPVSPAFAPASAPIPVPAPPVPQPVMRPAPQPPQQYAAPRQQPAPQWPTRRGPGPVRKFFVRLLITILLIAVPVAAAAIAYYLTAGELPDLNSIFSR